MTNTLSNVSVQQLKRALQIKEQIAALENEANRILGSRTTTTISRPQASRKKGGMSAAARAKISASAKARWAKIKAGNLKPVSAKASPAKKRSTVSAATREKISQAAKERWAKIKAAKA